MIDDEADYVTPNAKVNAGAKTKINELIEKLIGPEGRYIGVTATPARLDLNNTFSNDTSKWVQFPAHALYTGQDVFFPIEKKSLPYRLRFLGPGPEPDASRNALVRFLATSAYLNLHVNSPEQNYTMLVHTSGKKKDHETDRATIEQAVQALSDVNSAHFEPLVTLVHAAASELYPSHDADHITEYVVKNASRIALVVLNSERDRTSAGESATEASSPFTVIIGGNIGSRGVTFPNLLAMYFTRNVAHRLQQDTYIQRARMFGARGDYLQHFELTIPESLYADRHKCFVFHRLALETVRTGLGTPVWISDKRVAVASSSSIDKATVIFDKGEMSFGMFDWTPDLDEIAANEPNATTTLETLRAKIGNDALPEFLIKYIERVAPNGHGSLGVHASGSIAGYKGTADQDAISRSKGFIGNPQFESSKPQNGRGHLSVDSGLLVEAPYSFATRFAGEQGTNPEELIAAAHAGCFSMALTFALSKIGVTAHRIDTRAEISIAMSAGGPQVSAYISAPRFMRIASTSQRSFRRPRRLRGVAWCLDSLWFPPRWTPSWWLRRADASRPHKSWEGVGQRLPDLLRHRGLEHLRRCEVTRGRASMRYSSHML